jgi:serine/threonine-protein kinase ULK/ATG1
MQLLQSAAPSRFVRLYSATESANFVYLRMELCTCDLRQYLNNTRCVALPEALNLFRQILEAFAVIKAHNILHRDLKPENILLKFANDAADRIEVKIADFGGARLLDSKEMTQTHFCTRKYAAPEVLGEGRYGHAADVWSLGCVFYEVLTGRVPVAGEQLH